MKPSDPRGTLPAIRKRRQDLELAFLPAALEVIETPPSPIGRAVGVTLIALFCIALVWAAVGKIDIVATAPGKIVPSGRIKVIQPFEISVVRSIHVQDGQRVKEGDILIDLDPTASDADREHVQSELMATQLDIARLRAALADGNDPLANFHPPESASEGQIAMERQLVLSQTAEQHAKLLALDRQSAQKEADRDGIRATIGKLEATIPMLQQQVDVRQTLFEKGLGSKLNYLETLQAATEHQKDLEVEKDHLREAEAALGGIVQERAQAEAEFRRTLSEELAKAEEKAGGLTQDLVKAQKRTALEQLTAPVDGVVQQLSVHTVGGVVTPAQALLAVVPDDSKLEIEAMVPNSDIGFIHEGQGAEIKVHTFNFTRYGLLHGTVLSVSADAVSRDQSADKSATKGDTTSSEGDAGEPVYTARISLDRTQMAVEDKMVNLAPGMAVTVEVKTGSRSVLSYLLSPLARYSAESLHER